MKIELKFERYLTNDRGEHQEYEIGTWSKHWSNGEAIRHKMEIQKQLEH